MAKVVGTVFSLKDNCTPAITKIAQKFGMTKEEAKQLNAELRTQAKIIDEKLKSAIPAITGAVAAFAGATGMLVNGAMQAGDRIDKMSQKMQMSRKTFQELDYVFAQNGANIEIMQGSMAKLSKAMDGARTGNKANIKTFNQLGISLRDTNGKMKSTEKVMLEAIAKLQKMPEGARKTALAMDIFGKSATELAPILNGNAKDVEELRKRYHELGMGMSDEQIDAAVKLGDTFSDIKKSFQGLGNQIGADLLPTFQKLADEFVQNIPKIKSELTPIITKFGEAVGFVCNNLDVIIPAVGALVGAFTGLKIIGAVTGFITAFCNPVGLAVMGITALIGGFGVAYKKSEGFRNMVNGLASAVKLLAVWTFKVVGAVLKFFYNLVKTRTPMGLILDEVKLLCHWIGSLIDKFGGFAAIGNNIKNWADKKTKKALKKEEKTTVPHHALGTTSSAGGLALVGEYGPEIVSLPRYSSVIPTNRTEQFLNNSRNIEVKFEVHGNIYGEEDFMNKIINRFTLELNRVLV